jgi:hypothetical protein
MTSYLQMHKLALRPSAVPELAGYLLGIGTVEWTDWEIDFLEGLAARDTAAPISTRQREVLAELDDNAKSYAAFDGLNVATLVRNCWQARADLLEDDEAFIEHLHAQKVTSLKRRPVLRLLACARQLNLIDGYVKLG